MTTKVKAPLIINEWCIGCNICVTLYPENVLALGVGDQAAVPFPERCTCCKMCEMRCPDKAIALIHNEV